MKLLEDRINKDGHVLNNEILKVDSFLNHQIDVNLIDKIGEAIAEQFKDQKPTKVVTIETSGIAVAYAAAMHLDNVPLVFAKKQKSKITSENSYITNVKSFTKGIDYPVAISKDYVSKGDVVVIVDDFLAEGNASLGLIDLCNQAGAKVAGIGIAIEKGFQGGRKKLEALGIKVYSAAIVKEFKDNKVVFDN